MDKPVGFDERLAHSLDMMKKGERMGLSYNKDGPFLAFSGGKDSLALYHVAKMAGIKFVPEHTLTCIEPREVIYFIREHYPDVRTIRKPYTFWQYMMKKKELPSQERRYCCEYFKENMHPHAVTLVGLRAAESAKRASRNETWYKSRNKQRNRIMSMADLYEMAQETNFQCIKGKDAITISPLFHWKDVDVWYFIKEVAKVPYCSLYDQGYKRVGCIMCPLAGQKEIIKDAKRYPKYYDAFMRTIHRMRENGYLSYYPDMSDQDIFEWWLSKLGIRTWYNEHKRQGRLFE